MKNLEKLLSLVLSNPDNLNIEYSNVNGEERLVVNGEELTTDYSDLKKEVDHFRLLIDKIDTNDLVYIMTKMQEKLDVVTFNELLDQDSFSSKEAEVLYSMIRYAYTVIQDYVQNKINEYQDIIYSLKLD